jgi:hypothetical protein
LISLPLNDPRRQGIWIFSFSNLKTWSVPTWKTITLNTVKHSWHKH